MNDFDNSHVPDQKREQIEHMLSEADEPDEQTYAFLCLGALWEKREDWLSAIDNYTKALAAGSRRTDFLYYGNNNLGYSLIQLGRFFDAEGFCLAALEVDPARHNAHKNLGLVRQGQERWQEAAFCFIKAYSLCPNDKRAWHLLMALLRLHPYLLAQSENLRVNIAELEQFSEDTPLPN